jgi:hypothetical protein
VSNQYDGDLGTSADPVSSPITVLRELDGIWTNREATLV